MKEQYRRTTGRRTLKDYLMRYGPYLAFADDQDDPEELLRWFQDIDRKTYCSEKKNWMHFVNNYATFSSRTSVNLTSLRNHPKFRYSKRTNM